VPASKLIVRINSHLRGAVQVFKDSETNYRILISKQEKITSFKTRCHTAQKIILSETTQYTASYGN